MKKQDRYINETKTMINKENIERMMKLSETRELTNLDGIIVAVSKKSEDCFVIETDTLYQGNSFIILCAVQSIIKNFFKHIENNSEKSLVNTQKQGYKKILIDCIENIK